jgi:hypothetical protein
LSAPHASLVPTVNAAVLTATAYGLAGQCTSLTMEYSISGLSSAAF